MFAIPGVVFDALNDGALMGINAKADCTWGKSFILYCGFLWQAKGAQTLVLRLSSSIC